MSIIHTTQRLLHASTEILSNMLKHPVRFRRLMRDMNAYNRMNVKPEFRASWMNIYPCLKDWDDKAGYFDDVYFYQDLWAAKKVFHARPSEHYDIGSRVDGFIAHVLSFMPVTMIDIRPLPYKIGGLNFIQADATNLDGIADASLVSLSSLCAPEHFGLGRYGDPVDPEACFTALKSMQRVLAHGGRLYIAVPVGENNATSFNAHRIFRPELIVSTLDKLQLTDFAVIDGSNGFYERMTLQEFHAHGFGMNYQGGVVGLFEFVKD